MLLLLMSFIFAAHAQVLDFGISDPERLSGFKEFKNDKKIVDRERQKGEIAHLEELEQWERDRERARMEYSKHKVQTDPHEETIRYHEWLDEKKGEIKERIVLEQKYRDDRRKAQGHYKRPFSEEQEFDIFASGPRYEQKKRVLYGAESSFKSLRKKGSSASPSFDASGPSTAPSFNPPLNSGIPDLDNMGDPGYAPPPIIPEVPQPMNPGGDDYANGNAASMPITPPGFEDGDFPPPPPPPPGFEEGEQF